VASTSSSEWRPPEAVAPVSWSACCDPRATRPWCPCIQRPGEPQQVLGRSTQPVSWKRRLASCERRFCGHTGSPLPNAGGIHSRVSKYGGFCRLRCGPARALGFISVEERRLTAFRNAPNIVRIVDPSWGAWLRFGGGGKSVPRSPTAYKNQRARRVRTGTARASPDAMESPS
jgi:hypothetical protein